GEGGRRTGQDRMFKTLACDGDDEEEEEDEGDRENHRRYYGRIISGNWGDEPRNEQPAPAPVQVPGNVSPFARAIFDTTAGRWLAPQLEQLAPSPFNGGSEHVTMVAPAWLVRGENYDTVYFVTEAGERRPFWNTAIFFTYNDSWNSII